MSIHYSGMRWHSGIWLFFMVVHAHACVEYVNADHRWMGEPICEFEGRQVWIGSPIVALTLGDFNGDGRPDLAVRTADEVRVLLNSGGTLAWSIATATGFRAEPRRSLICCDPIDVAADFNRDGKLDLMLGERNVMLIGLGDGNFLAPHSLSGHPPSGLTGIGDFDGDRNVDLLYSLNGAVAVRLGNGDGTFRPAGVVRPGEGKAYAADLDGDGYSDVVHLSCIECQSASASAPNWGRTVNVFFADGRGEFLEPVNLAVPAMWSRDLAIDDLNNDGWPDIISSAYVLFNKGSRMFEEARQYRPVFDLDQPPLGPAGVTDLDGDGVRELLWYETSDGRTTVALRVGADGLPSFRLKDGFLFHAWEVVDRRFGGIADFDGDGRPDLIIAVFGPGDGHVLGNVPLRPEASISILFNRIPR